MAQNACFDVGKCLLWVLLTFKKIGAVGAQKPHNYRRTMPWALMEQPIFIVNGSKCVFWHTEVPFVGLIGFWKKLGPWGPKKSHNFRRTMPWALMEQPIFIVNGSKCVFRHTEVPFVGLIGFWKKLGLWGPKNPIIFAVQCPQHERSNRFSSLMAQNACFDIRTCPLGVWLTCEKNCGRGGPKTPKFSPYNALNTNEATDFHR